MEDDLPIFVVEYVAKDKMRVKRFTYTDCTEDMVTKIQAYENAYTGEVLQLNWQHMEEVLTYPYNPNLN